MPTSKKRSKYASNLGATQLGFAFEEDKGLFGSPADILRCDGAPVAIDCETGGLDWWRDPVRGIGVYCPARSVSVFVETVEPAAMEECRLNLRKIGDNPETMIRGHNLKFDAHFMGLHLWGIRAGIEDSTVLGHLIDSRLSKRLGDMEQRWLGQGSKYAHLAGAKDGDVRTLPPGPLAKYCIDDCRITYELVERLRPMVVKGSLLKLFLQQMEFIRVLHKIEERGMLLDMEFVERAIRRFEKNMVAMEAEFFSKLGQRIDWRSPQQLSKAMYAGMGIEKPKDPFADKEGQYHGNLTRLRYNKTSTSSFILMEKANHPLGALLMDLRETDKLRDVMRMWQGLAEYKDGQYVLHTSYNPTGTRTGRLSSSRPNFQNVAGKERTRDTQSVYSGGTIRADEYNLRAALMARPGHKFVSIDYKQQEMRMFAIMANEPEMVAALKRKEDIHGMIARAVWPDDCADPKLFPIRREWSKTIGFGLIYGMRIASLQMRLNMTRPEAEKVTEMYWSRFPRIMPFLKETAARVEEKGFVRYWSGRIWREDNPLFCYKGANAMVQGGSADLMSISTQRVDKRIDELSCGGIVNLVHDEQVLELQEGCLPETALELSAIMEVPDLLGLPFATDMKIGDNYGDLVKWNPSKEKVTV